MSAKGSEAKNSVISKIKEAFGEDYILTEGSKVYVWAEDGANGRVQIAMALTCPKVMVGECAPVAVVGNRLDFEAELPQTQTDPAQMTEQEKNNIEELMKRLNL